MNRLTHTVTVKATGRRIEVYKHSERDTYVSMVDYSTEYQAHELKF